MRVRIWDLPTRLFHWALAIAVAAALTTGLLGGNLMVWHGRIGLLILGLLVFRLAWGFLGTTHARFRSFLPTPRRVADYLHGRWQGAGHNPLGALAIFVLLGLLLWQAGSGLFSNDDIAFDGPLAGLLDKATSDRLTGLHRQGLWVIVGLVTLHVSAAFFYLIVRGNNLIQPMVTGCKAGKVADAYRPAAVWALPVAVVLAGAVVWLAAGGLLSPPPPPPPEAFPDW